MNVLPPDIVGKPVVIVCPVAVVGEEAPVPVASGVEPVPIELDNVPVVRVRVVVPRKGIEKDNRIDRELVVLTSY